MCISLSQLTSWYFFPTAPIHDISKIPRPSPPSSHIILYILRLITKVIFWDVELYNFSFRSPLLISRCSRNRSSSEHCKWVKLHFDYMCALNCTLSINLLLATNRLPLPPTQNDVKKIRKQQLRIQSRAKKKKIKVESGRTNSLELEAGKFFFLTSGNERIINV